MRGKGGTRQASGVRSQESGPAGSAQRGVPSLVAGLTLVWCGMACGQEPAEPQPFVTDVFARPIEEATPTSEATTLRWKSKPRGSVTDYVASEGSAQPLNQRSQPPLRAGWNITRIDPNVRQAQHTTSDPFSDPFGDRKASHNSEPSLILQPTQAESGIEELPPPRKLSPVRRAAPSTSMMPASQPGGGFPPGGMREMEPAERTSVPCDRIYNDRNCCDVDSSCHEFRDRLLTDSIRNISLDITPRYNPDLTREEDEADRADKLRLLETRQWRNRRGAVIATGKMIKLQNNSVVLADDSGNETARVAISELGEDELCYITAWWRLPSECPLGGIRTMDRAWLASTFNYHASGLCHKPLYWEEVQLERYGHTAGPLRQPLISGAHFFINLAALPYKMAINPPTECQYPLGYYRPGNCAPWMIPPIPLSLRGAAAEVGAAIGMAYIIP
jgi:hypothetical protein